MAKYQKGLESTKKKLKESTLPELIEYCNGVGFTKKETDLIVLRYRKGEGRDKISFDEGICLTTLSTKYTVMLKIMKRFLISAGLIDEDFMN